MNARARAVTACGLAFVLSLGVGCARQEDGAGSGDADTTWASQGPVGWAAVYKTEAKEVARGHSPTASFALEPGQSVHPAVPPSGFSVEYEGIVEIQRPGRYRFGAEVEGGQATVTVSSQVGPSTSASIGEDVTPVSLELPAGSVRVTYEFSRDADRRARFRPMWTMDREGMQGFVEEPVPSRVVRVSGSSADESAQWLAADRGRVLLGDLGCVHCHGGGEHIAVAREAPDLAQIADRASGAWLASWVEDPQALKPGSGMPSVMHVESGESTSSLVAFLRSVSDGSMTEWPAPATEASVLDTGRALYDMVGCVACHGAPSGVQASGHEPRFPFGDLGGKWNPGALSAYLQPGDGGGAHHRASLGVTQPEADALANYLSSVWGAGEASPRESDGAQIDAGRRIFAETGCASCHDLAGVESTLEAPPITLLDPMSGCLDPEDASTPRYDLSEGQRADLAAALDAISGWTGHEAPTDFAHLAVETLNCVACHAWHGDPGVDEPIRDLFLAEDDADLGDEGRFPPELSGVGWKLTNVWMAQVVGSGARARPYMLTRMPAFSSTHTSELVDALARIDGVFPGEDVREPEVTDRAVQGGLTLVGTGGLNCLPCHVFGDNPPLGLPGPDISTFGERIRYEWWDDYIKAPHRFKPGTRMPAFFASGSSPIATVAGGDMQAQADAMWAYFSLGSLFMPGPEGLPSPDGLEVQVVGEPRVLRAFLQGVGARGIALGFPTGLHFAYDANTSTLRYAWTGSFLDATGAWAGRGGTTLGGQGPVVWDAPEGPAIAIGERPNAWPEAPTPAFGGYLLDDERVPTFLSSLDGVEIEETMRPYPHSGAWFSRTILVRGIEPGQMVWLRIGADAQVTEQTGGSVEPVEGRPGEWRVRAESDEVRIVTEVLQ